jgi:serine/threonine protein kinase/formylglycine-generating enzyme required for sulfatase activity
MDTSPVDEDALRRFEVARRSGRAGALEQFLPAADSPTYLGTLAALVDLEMRLAWADWKPPADGLTVANRPHLLESYLQRFPQLNQPPLVLRLIQREYLVRHSNGDRPSPGEYCQRFPAVVRDEQGVLAFAETKSDESLPSEPSPVYPSAEVPSALGGYRVLGKLGAGNFGVVYKGYDDQLGRYVAIKVPHRHLFSDPQHVARYLAEARVLASLEHPAIVPIYAVGKTNGLCFLVSKFVEGSDLAVRLAQGLLPFVASVELVAAVAEALHYTHLKRMVHRDVKPANILLDTAGRPYLTDFGLALRDEEFGRGSGFVGTPVYMSPEQARGEGHRVDGRSDIFSLGVVFYELLTGRLPFRGETREELLEQIAAVEPRPPRQANDAIPKELERICLKALAKRASERYTTTRDLAEDLRYFLAQANVVRTVAPPLPMPTPVTSEPKPTSQPVAVVPVGSSTELRSVRIVPKGLRSFDTGDADFFLDLLPGPRDREDLPEALRFWKRRIEQTDAEQSFSVGLLYGPSGCGKSSLVKAGLLPRLARSVRVVYVEATTDETEARLLKALRKRCTGLPDKLGLAEALATLRRGRGLEAGEKVLLVLDQFEQFLHARNGEENSMLAQSLRQCDGERVQALLMVRDDFWMAVVRFLEELEVRIVQGENAAAVDLFDPRHARKVLEAFGRAFGALPEASARLSKEQEAFLDQAVAGLAQERRVVCVHLAMFTEMTKGRPWSPKTLREVGGTAGVGVAFLEETFSSAMASPSHRLHQEAARTVLQALLPEQGTEIKGHMRSWQELLEASGYARRPREFEELLRILDGEVRLITPTDPGGEDSQDDRRPASPAAKYYQLTHDYLVPALRDWLARKQKETRRGRAELCLAERAALWSRRPENRHLPVWWEWARIVLFTRKCGWTPAQRSMMRKAGKYHAVRGLALLLVLLVLGWVGYQQSYSLRAQRAQSLVESILTAETDDIGPLVEQLGGLRSWADLRLIMHLQNSPVDSKEHLHASLALLPVDEGQVEYLYKRLLRAGPKEVKVIRDTLLPNRPALRERLWRVLQDDTTDDRASRAKRLRAACALASDEREVANSQRWKKMVIDELLDEVEEDHGRYTPLMKMLLPWRQHLREPLAAVFRNAERPQSERSIVASLVAAYGDDAPDWLIELALDADAELIGVLWEELKKHSDLAVAICEQTVSESPRSQTKKERRAQRQSNAGVILFGLGQADKVWQMLCRSPDPSPRSSLIHKFALLMANPQPLVDRLPNAEVAIQEALILALGEFSTEQLPAARREELVSALLRTYRDNADPGLHGAAEWLLCQWHKEDELRKIDDTLATGKVEGQRCWYLTGKGQTMVVVRGPGRFLMGSPPTEAEREGGRDGPLEEQHSVPFGYSFSIASKEVTVDQFKAFPFAEKHDYSKDYSPTSRHPVNNVTWDDAARYCNELSRAEGVAEAQWCYQRSKNAEMEAKPDYLTLKGYRLPTEQEWEYACRAGTTTSRYFGESEELMGKYAWYAMSLQERLLRPRGNLKPTGSLKPNDLGLFDMLGNALEWTQNDTSDDIQRYVLRGGTFGLPAWVARSASRHPIKARDYRNIYLGFRLARTVD